MNYLDKNGCYDKGLVIKGISEMEDGVAEELEKEHPDKKKVSQMRMEQLLRGIYLLQNPFK